jgi:phosphoribosylamine-glycine ligase
MLDLVQGRDTLRVSDKIAVGVLLAHGDFPRGGAQIGTWAGYPIKGVTEENVEHLHLQQVQMGNAEQLKGPVRGLQTAGNYVMVVSGSGSTVLAAMKATYRTVLDIKWPSNVMYRTDIGERLKKDLPKVQRHGFAKGMRFD